MKKINLEKYMYGDCRHLSEYCDQLWARACPGIYSKHRNPLSATSCLKLKVTFLGLEIISSQRCLCLLGFFELILIYFLPINYIKNKIIKNI